MRPLLGPFKWAGRHGRILLVAGLVAGIALPDLARAVKPWIGIMVGLLLFVAAIRVGPRGAIGAAGHLRASLGFTLAFQLVLPIIMVLMILATGWLSPLSTVLILMAAAPPISGSPNLTILTGHDPAPALRQLVAGTALLPLTVVPVFWLMPTLGDAGVVLPAAGRLLLIIAVSAAAGFALRVVVLPTPARETLAAIDGLSAILMAILVIGLMAAVGPAIRGEPGRLASTLLVAFAANFSIQILVAGWLRRTRWRDDASALAIGAGNRNIALFLAALPATMTDPLLLFIGCYQVPMYLTPILLDRFHRTGGSLEKFRHEKRRPETGAALKKDPTQKT